MGTTTKDTISTLAPGQGVLTALRALVVQPPHFPHDLLHAADQQAELLRKLLPGLPGHSLEHLTRLIPSIFVDYVDTIPVPGISFWGKGTWHMYIRAGDPIDIQAFTGLHQLKHIIDHPLRRQWPELLDGGDWEGVADWFAERVLTGEPTHTTTQPRDPTGRQHVSLRFMTRKGGCYD